MARFIPLISRYHLEQARIEHHLLFFVTISHPDLDRDVTLVTDDKPHLFEGTTWESGWFELGLLTDSNKPPQTTFRFPNVDKRRLALMEKIVGPAQVDYQVYSSHYFDLDQNPRLPLDEVSPVAIYTALYLELTNVKITDEDVEGTLMSFDPRTETWPTGTVTEEEFPGVGLQ